MGPCASSGRVEAMSGLISIRFVWIVCHCPLSQTSRGSSSPSASRSSSLDSARSRSSSEPKLPKAILRSTSKASGVPMIPSISMTASSWSPSFRRQTSTSTIPGNLRASSSFLIRSRSPGDAQCPDSR